MQRRIVFIFAIVAFFSVALAASWENTKVDRTINLMTNVARHYIDITATVTGTSSESVYEVVLPKQQAEHLAFIAAQDKSGNILHVAPQPELAKSGEKVFGVELNAPVASGDSIKLTVVMAFTKMMVPYPVEIEQSAIQLVKYDDNIYFSSPYASHEQRTVVKLASGTVKTFSELRPTSRRQEEITYGKYLNVEASAEEPLHIHFENNSPFATFDSIEREFDISHWRAQVSVEERVHVSHTGAKLAEGFSRLDYQRMQSGVSSFRSLALSLPANAADAYFRDEIGNISSSSLRPEGDHQFLELRLRYPLFGGWSNTFYYGYNEPIYDLVSTDSEGHYVLNATFHTHIQGAPVDVMTVRVVLPEGAVFAGARVPFAVEESFSEYRSFLDVAGRTVVVLTLRNAVPEHTLHFQVLYTYSFVSALLKPARLILAFGAFFAIALFVSRLDFGLSPKSKTA